MCLQCRSVENNVGKGEIAHNKQFLLFPHCLLPIRRTFCHFPQIQNCRLQTLSVWKSLKFVVWERGKTWDCGGHLSAHKILNISQQRNVYLIKQQGADGL